MTLKEFFDKIDWEGGYEEAFIGYGLTADDITDITKVERNEINKRIVIILTAIGDLEELRPEQEYE